MREKKGLLIQDVEQAKPACRKGTQWTVFSDDGSIRHCIGCFGCWLKTPGKCVIRDAYGNMGACLAQSDEVVLVSRCCFGGPSPFIKNVLDRCIPYIHPYFVNRNGEMHHRQRYQRTFNLTVVFYGERLTERERQTARGWVRAMSVNLCCNVKQILFEEQPPEWEGLLRTLY